MDNSEKLRLLKEKQSRVLKAIDKSTNKELLQFFVDVIPMALDADRCSIFIHNLKSESAWIQCGTNLEEHQISVPNKDSLVGQTVSTGKTIIENDMDQRVGQHDIIGVKTGYRTHSVLCVPVMSSTKEGTTGAIQVLNKRVGKTFDEADLKIVQRLALLIQGYVENIFLKQDLREIAELMAKEIASLES